MTDLAAFFKDLPLRYPPLLTTKKGEAAVHLVVWPGDVVAISWLQALKRGAGREAMSIIIEAADRHGVTLELTAKPQKPQGEGKKLTPAKLEKFYAEFGFAPAGRGEFTHMARKPK